MYTAGMQTDQSPAAASGTYDLWGAELSPFALKLEAILEWSGVSYRWLPREGKRWENMAAAFRVNRAKRSGRVYRHGGSSELDEYPSVPFLVAPDGEVHYDSSAIADWLDSTFPHTHKRLLPADPVQNFVVRLIDEAFDEFGLYMVHHNRWVLAAADNGAGERLSKEFARLLPPGGSNQLAKRFPKRQVRRLPYLFSIAGDDFKADLPSEITPPGRAGFPATHALLDHAWYDYLDAMESVLARQPYLLGEQFTLADASAYGQLSMNLTDASASQALIQRAPLTHQWLCAIRDSQHVSTHSVTGSEDSLIEIRDALRPLLEIISETFIPLMIQNELAYIDFKSQGQTLFNESAFDQGQALFEGELRGQPFRHVVKSFQVRTWRDLRTHWQALSSEEQAKVESWVPSMADAFIASS
jgi:glutathione S-transferase